MSTIIGSRPSRPQIKAYTDVLTFGKYKGHTVKYILDREPSYLMWLHDDGICEVDFEILNEAQDRDFEMRDYGVDMWDFMAD